jgi:hypothetical protein
MEDRMTPTEKITLISVQYDSKIQELLNNIESGNVKQIEIVKHIVSTSILAFWNEIKSIPHLYTRYYSDKGKIKELEDNAYNLHVALYNAIFIED